MVELAVRASKTRAIAVSAVVLLVATITIGAYQINNRRNLELVITLGAESLHKSLLKLGYSLTISDQPIDLSGLRCLYTQNITVLLAAAELWGVERINIEVDAVYTFSGDNYYVYVIRDNLFVVKGFPGDEVSWRNPLSGELICRGDVVIRLP